MKATMDFDDTLYRRLKIEAARRGRFCHSWSCWSDDVEAWEAFRCDLN